MVYSGDHHINFVNNLVNVCDPCDYCSKCRPQSLNFTSDIYGVFQISSNLPIFVEDPQTYLPRIPECDLAVALEIHPDLLLALPEHLSQSKVTALIVPADASHWLKPGLRKQLREILEDLHMEYAFPKPYCSLDYDEDHPLINRALSYFRIGTPTVEVDLKGTTIHTARCIRSAPCGSTWYICEKLKNVCIDDVVETISSAHHSFPCNASMNKDAELKDTPLHEAGYIVRKAVLTALEEKGISLVNTSE
jgi:hypothetical protein